MAVRLSNLGGAYAKATASNNSTPVMAFSSSGRSLGTTPWSLSLQMEYLGPTLSSLSLPSELHAWKSDDHQAVLKGGIWQLFGVSTGRKLGLS